VIAVGLVSLGCAKNQVDSEVMLGLLRRRGFEITHKPERADVLVVNTCGFLESAREEGYQTLRELAELKRSGRCRKLIATGCMVQWRLPEMERSLPEVDQFLALNDVEKIVEACEPGSGKLPTDEAPATYLPDETVPRFLTDPGPSAYLKISEGCDNPCAFCVIPQIRGRFRSRSVESLVAEAGMMAEIGVCELNLIAQDSTSYGLDTGNEAGLPGLLEALAEVKGIEWLRVLYAYPNKITPRLVEILGGHPKVLPYLDVPLQHASRSALSRMLRGGSRSSFSRMIDSLRKAAPELSLRTTFIVGFPGETDQEFDELRRFVQETRFDHVGLFTYSHEPSAPSSSLPDDVPESLKLERLQELQDIQEQISMGKYRTRIGSVLEVLVEGAGEDSGTQTGRAWFQAPEVDGNVIITGVEELTPPPGGSFVKVLVEEALPYSLIGGTIQPGFSSESPSPPAISKPA
jgi:ribosomal protein S12 methylthiotransferase